MFCIVYLRVVLVVVKVFSTVWQNNQNKIRSFHMSSGTIYILVIVLRVWKWTFLMLLTCQMTWHMFKSKRSVL